MSCDDNHLSVIKFLDKSKSPQIFGRIEQLAATEAARDQLARSLSPCEARHCISIYSPSSPGWYLYLPEREGDDVTRLALSRD